jgi:hypothetical protein
LTPSVDWWELSLVIGGVFCALPTFPIEIDERVAGGLGGCRFEFAGSPEVNVLNG